ncbi:MAG: hypothetical protein KKD99_06860 [Proteobacteria bacterium]|nr:hypothetical protein [Pseudomonadota bacterium]
MERRSKLTYQGKEIETVEIDFKVVKEDWNEYELADGTKIRMKAVTSYINRAIDVFDSDGNPLYLLKSSNVLALSVPGHLKKGEEVH